MPVRVFDQLPGLLSIDNDSASWISVEGKTKEVGSLRIDLGDFSAKDSPRNALELTIKERRLVAAICGEIKPMHAPIIQSNTVTDELVPLVEFHGILLRFEGLELSVHTILVLFAARHLIHHVEPVSRRRGGWNDQVGL